jgi:putative transcriptional regulator
MPPNLLARLFACLALVAALSLLPATLLRAALPTPAQSPPPASLAGQLLIAAPAMSDPRFDRAVILMVRHSQTGALGIAINQPLGERPLAMVLDALGEKDSGASGAVRIFIGGPVQPEVGFVIHSSDYRAAGTLDLDGHVAMTSSREILRDIAHGGGPSKRLIAFGYAGWGPGQLEGEMANRFWFTAPADAKLIFDEDRDKVWDEAMKRRTQDL